MYDINLLLNNNKDINIDVKQALKQQYNQLKFHKELLNNQR